MRVIDIKKLARRLPSTLRLARSGETIFVADGDRVVAEIRPPSSPTVHEAFVAEGVREGWLTPRRTPKGPLPDGLIRGPKLKPGELQRLLDDMRSDRS